MNVDELTARLRLTLSDRIVRGGCSPPPLACAARAGRVGREPPDSTRALWPSRTPGWWTGRRPAHPRSAPHPRSLDSGVHAKIIGSRAGCGLIRHPPRRHSEAGHGPAGHRSGHNVGVHPPPRRSTTRRHRSPAWRGTSGRIGCSSHGPCSSSALWSWPPCSSWRLGQGCPEGHRAATVPCGVRGPRTVPPLDAAGAARTMTGRGELDFLTAGYAAPTSHAFEVC